MVFFSSHRDAVTLHLIRATHIWRPVFSRQLSPTRICHQSCKPPIDHIHLLSIMTISFWIVCQSGMLPLAYPKAMAPTKSIKLLDFLKLRPCTLASNWGPSVGTYRYSRSNSIWLLSISGRLDALQSLHDRAITRIQHRVPELPPLQLPHVRVRMWPKRPG